MPATLPRKPFVDKSLSHKILGCAFRVYNELGNGFLEKVYENALVHELKKNGLRAEAQRKIDVYYDGVCVGEYFADVVVNDRVILELKVCDGIAPIHEAQLLHYLKATGYRIGYILNFGSEGKLEFRRFVL